VIEWPRIVPSACWLLVGQVCVFGVTINPDSDLVGGPPQLVGVPLVDGRTNFALPLKRGATVRLRLVCRAPEVKRADYFITRYLIKIF
jgi:hypothetical protein